MLVIIDSPDFTHRVARRVRARDPAIPIVDYVSPSVWAWRPGRARAMRPMSITCWRCCRSSRRRTQRLRGPPCSYVGHPLTEQLAMLRPEAEEQRRGGCAAAGAAGAAREAAAARSGITWRCSARRSAGCNDEGVAFELILPTMPHLSEAVARGVKSWPVQPRVVIGEAEKRAAFRIAHAALAKSGTVTLELALSAYRW